MTRWAPGAVAIAAIAAIAWLAAPGAGSGVAPAPLSAPRGAAGGLAAAGAPPPVHPVREVAPAATDAEDWRAWVDWKYRYLLDDAELDPPARRRLARLLARREQLVRDPDAASELGEVEAELEGMLGAADRARYQALRDSDREQAELTAYGDGIDNVAPLDEPQRKRLLTAKLRHKAVLERELARAGLSRPALSPDERRLAHAVVDSALARYRDDFLGEASEVLDELQLVLLCNYEATELEHARRELQVAINAR